MKNPLLSRKVPQSAHGYSAFAMDNFANFTSAPGYLIPVYWDYLEPGDKVTLKTLLRTKTQPFTKPAMATVIERIEWFAVPIQQLYKEFGAKFYGISDIDTDLMPQNGYDDYTPFMYLDEINSYILSLPTSFTIQSALPVTLPTLTEAKRLCDALGLPDSLGSNALGEDSYYTAVSVLPFAAYHKIYFDHYRLTDREQNDPTYYNFDSYFGVGGQSTHVDNSTNRYNKIFWLHKRPYMRDYFTGMQVSPLFGSQDVNAAGVQLGALQNWLNGLTHVESGSPSGNPDLGHVSFNSLSPSSVRLPAGGTTTINRDGLAGSLNPSNIRSLFAVEKLLEVTRRAKKHYDMQTLAHFGVKVPKGLAGECYKLGTHEQFLKIGEVISTANTVDQQDDQFGALGQLGGTGSSGAESKKIHFEADCHCVLMAIYSAEPVVNVKSDGISRQLTQIRASEWYKSEFDDLGMQPVFRRELYATRSQVAGDNNTVIGWNYRYYQMKMKYNRSFAGCASAYFQEWSLNRSSIGSGSGFSRNFFYVWPTDLNNILLLPYPLSIGYSNCYAFDPFIHQVYFDVVKSSKKSIYGDPNL